MRALPWGPPVCLPLQLPGLCAPSRPQSYNKRAVQRQRMEAEAFTVPPMCTDAFVPRIRTYPACVGMDVKVRDSNRGQLVVVTSPCAPLCWTP